MLLENGVTVDNQRQIKSLADEKKERKGIDKFKYEKIRGPSISIWSELLIATKPLF